MAEVEEICPVAVWDVGDPGWRHDREAKTRWLEEQGLPASDMYRAEFWLIDAPFARIFCYAHDDNGCRYCAGHSPFPHDHLTAKEPPRDVPLSGLPPRELLGR